MTDQRQQSSHVTAQVAALIPLADYEAPALPTDERLKRFIGKAKALFGNGEGSAFIADEQLKKATLRDLNRVVAPPAAGPVMAEIDLSISAWLGAPPTAERVKAIVLPPCDNTNVVAAWAEAAGHRTLSRTNRDADPAVLFETLADCDPDALLVVPRLEEWFLRTPEGLAPIRALIAWLDQRRQRCVIGCNSWGWAFLAKAVDVDLLVGAPLIFQPFDGPRLAQWFGELATDEKTSGTRFRLVEGGVDLFCDDNDAAASDFFETLAGRSRGIPWVAWHMWRRTLRTEREDDTASSDEEETLWIAGLAELVLPGDQPRDALLVLHALAIHGQLTAPELRAVLPIVGEATVLPALIAGGFIERDDVTLTLRPEAYPAIRDGLRSAGLPIGAA